MAHFTGAVKTLVEITTNTTKLLDFDKYLQQKMILTRSENSIFQALRQGSRGLEIFKLLRNTSIQLGMLLEKCLQQSFFLFKSKYVFKLSYLFPTVGNRLKA